MTTIRGGGKRLNSIHLLGYRLDNIHSGAGVVKGEYVMYDISEKFDFANKVEE